tara:strand:- start:925 stop:1377 length:453 start_codon:yes stop_codon:yes gene_type:complete
MATTGIINGTKFAVYVWHGTYKLIGYSTSCNISITQDTRNTTTQATGMWNTRTIGSKDWEVSCESLVAMSGSAGELWNDIFSNYLDDTNVVNYIPTFQLRFQTNGGNVSGDNYLYGPAILTSLSIEAPQELSATMSVSFIASGPLLKGTQ